MTFSLFSRRGVTFVAAAGGTLLLSATVARPAHAQYSIRGSGGQPFADVASRLLFTGGLNLVQNDSGFDVEPFVDPDPTYPGRTIQQVTIQQVSISSGLFAIYQYDGATKVFGTQDANPLNNDGTNDFLGSFILSEMQVAPYQISSDPPYYFHNHFLFRPTNPTVADGTSFAFQFRLTNLYLIGENTSLASTHANSDVFTINYIKSSTPPPTQEEDADIVFGFRPQAPGRAIPEPGTLMLALMGGGLPTLGLLRRRAARA